MGGGHNGINLNAGLHLEFRHYQLCECLLNTLGYFDSCWMSALSGVFCYFHGCEI